MKERRKKLKHWQKVKLSHELISLTCCCIFFILGLLGFTYAFVYNSEPIKEIAVGSGSLILISISLELGKTFFDILEDDTYNEKN